MKEQESITAKVLCDAFIENKAKAKRAYGNRRMKISGYAVHIGPDMYGLPRVELSEQKDSAGRTIIKYPNDMRKLTLITAFIIATLSLNAQTTKSMETEKQNSPIAAKELYDAFAKDKAQAEKEYRLQTMKISGFVTYVGPDPYTLPSIELSEKKGGKSRVLCVLPFSDYFQLRRVSKGNEVVMEGEVRSLYEKDQTIVVKECKIIEIKK